MSGRGSVDGRFRRPFRLSGGLSLSWHGLTWSRPNLKATSHIYASSQTLGVIEPPLGSESITRSYMQYLMMVMQALDLQIRVIVANKRSQSPTVHFKWNYPNMVHVTPASTQ